MTLIELAAALGPAGVAGAGFTASRSGVLVNSSSLSAILQVGQICGVSVQSHATVATVATVATPTSKSNPKPLTLFKLAAAEEPPHSSRDEYAQEITIFYILKSINGRRVHAHHQFEPDAKICRQEGAPRR